MRLAPWPRQVRVLVTTSRPSRDRPGLTWSAPILNPQHNEMQRQQLARPCKNSIRGLELMPTFPPFAVLRGRTPVRRQRPRHPRPWGGLRSLPVDRSARPRTPHSPSSDLEPALTFDELIARQKAAVAGQQQALATPQATIAGGLGQMLTSYMEGLKGYKAEQEESEGRQQLAQLLSGFDPAAANAQEIIGQASIHDPDLAIRMREQLIQSRRDAAKREQELADLRESRALHRKDDDGRQGLSRLPRRPHR